MIRENQNEATNERFEKEMELIEKELEAKETSYDESIEALDKKLEEYLAPQNLTKVVGEAMTKGFVDVLGETVNLDNAMKEMFMSTEVGISNINLQYNDWLETINSVKDAMYELNTYTTGANLKSVIDMNEFRTPAEAITINFAGLSVAGGIDSLTLPEVEKALKEQEKHMIKMITELLGGKKK